MAYPDFRSLRAQQEKQRDKFDEYHSSRKRKIVSMHEARLDDMKKRHEEARKLMCAKVSSSTEVIDNVLLIHFSIHPSSQTLRTGI